MKRWLTHATIALYLGALSWGILSHAVNYLSGAHPVMYYLVWDMFCGWSGYSGRAHIIGEGESGRFYELSPGPWGEMHPYGHIGRRQYDPPGNHTFAIANNVLKHTQHEPITRIFYIEEAWHKKYNMPDYVWKNYYQGPKEKKSYFQVRTVFTRDGYIAQMNPSFFEREMMRDIADNPRLQADVRKGQPFYTFNRRQQRRTAMAAELDFRKNGGSRVGSRLGE